MLNKLCLPALLILVLATPAAAAQTLSIADIHGDGHVPTALGREVTTEGIVTLVADNIFWIQTPGASRERAGLAVEMAETPQVARGDRVRVSGRIEQQRPENRPQDLGVTRLVEPRVELIAGGQSLPDPVLIGPGGREIPSVLAPDDFAGPLRPDANAIDFWTALNGMRVELAANRVVGASAWWCWVTSTTTGSPSR